MKIIEVVTLVMLIVSISVSGVTIYYSRKTLQVLKNIEELQELRKMLQPKIKQPRKRTTNV